MPLTDLAKEIARNRIENYYEKILANYDNIIKAVKETNQGIVAKQLDMTPTKFSAIYNLLLAYADAKDRDNADT